MATSPINSIAPHSRSPPTSPNPGDTIAGFPQIGYGALMPRTLGYHYVKSGYGLWLPGDNRGSWSQAWDEQIGFAEPHTLNPGDPVRQRMAKERMKREPVRLDAAMIDAVVGAIDRCASSSPWRLAATSIESTHMHLLITSSGLDIKRTIKWLAQQTTKAVHRQTDHVGPVWCEGYWCSYVFDTAYWTNLVQYIQRHNLRRSESATPYSFLAL